MSSPPMKKSRYDLKGHPIVKYQNVLRWTLDTNDITRLANRRMSPTMIFDDRKWGLSICKYRADLRVYLIFKNERNDPRWLMQIDGTCKVVKDSKENTGITMKMSPNACFTHGNPSIQLCIFKNYFRDQSRLPFHVEITFNLKFYDFSTQPERLSNVMVNIGNVKFDVNKEVLMTFSGRFAEKLANCEKETEIKIENFTYQQFCHFLAAINPVPITADMRSYEFMMKMADKWVCPNLHVNVVQFLKQTNELTLIQKLKLADAREEYEHVLQAVIESLQSERQIKNLALEADFDSLQLSTKYRVITCLLNF